MRRKKWVRKLEERVIRRKIMLDEIKCIERFLEQLEGGDKQE